MSRYAFLDLIALRIARQLREAGVALQDIRNVVHYQQKRGYKNPLADAYLIVAGNGDVVEKTHDKLLTALRSPGQAYFVFALGEAVSEVEAIARTLKPPSRGKACAVA
jgi:hypothetical protein